MVSNTNNRRAVNPTANFLESIAKEPDLSKDKNKTEQISQQILDNKDR